MKHDRLILVAVFSGFLIWMSPFAPSPWNYLVAIIGIAGLSLSFGNAFLDEESRSF